MRPPRAIHSPPRCLTSPPLWLVMPCPFVPLHTHPPKSLFSLLIIHYLHLMPR